MGRRPTTIEEVRERVATHCTPCPITGCWWWLGGVSEKGRGYGVITIKGWKGYAHRVAYEVAHGPIPPGLFVCHRCDNGKLGCVNPGHLYAGTAWDNSQDAVRLARPRRDSGLRGERHGMAKLTRSQVEQIRFMASSGLVASVIAKEFGISRRHASSIITGRHWSDRIHEASPAPTQPAVPPVGGAEVVFPLEPT